MLTAVIALPLLIALIVKGSQPLFAAFILVVAVIGLAEFYRMALPGRKTEAVVASVLGAPLALVPLLSNPLLLPVLTALVLIAALALLFRFSDIRQAAQEWALLAAGLLYVPLLLSQLLLLKAEPFGECWILLMMLIVMSGDSAAYYVGSALGRNKLYPAVSPNKSIEGALGGLAGSVAGAFVAKLTFFPQLGVVDCIATALVLGVLGQLGDLFESLLKRSCGVKDSGTIVPGHGGILDRLDSILFAAPAAWWYAHFIFTRG
nr:phosphatidate cytidylyltransferase [Geoanaerobacter pelophilus]